MEDFAPGVCPSCKHPQHVGRPCNHPNDGDVEGYFCQCPPQDAIKHTKGKTKGWRLFPWEVMPELLGIWQYGISKGYLADSWRKVAPEEYEEALMRHVTAVLRGEILDPESGKRHIAHATWNCIVLMVLS